MKKLLLLTALLSLSAALFGQALPDYSAQDYFDAGAQAFIENKFQLAQDAVSEGLQKYPNDKKLQELAKLLKEQQQQQQQQQQAEDQEQNKDKQGQQQQQNQQQSQNQQNQSQQNQQQPEKKEGQDQQQQAGQRPTDQQQQGAAASNQKNGDKDKEGEQAAAYPAGQMTPEQARQLLDAQKGDERMLVLKPEGKPLDQSRPIKDW